MIVDIKKSFEMPSQEEWDNLLATEHFESMRLDEALLKDYEKYIMLYPRLMEAFTGHNNKVGALEITYVLCKHYFDKGIPDDRWYISPGTKGQSVEYDPDFEEEHYMRRFWFNHYAENIYLKYFSLWDNIIDIVNIYFDLDIKNDMRMRSSVMKWLKSNQKDLYDFLYNTAKDEIYKKANEYRTCFVHGIAPSELSDLYPYKKNTTAKVPYVKDGKLAYKEVSGATVLTMSVGNYTPVKYVMNNIEEFAEFSGKQINNFMRLLLSKGVTHVSK